jgi:hypothetical protein
MRPVAVLVVLLACGCPSPMHPDERGPACADDEDCVVSCVEARDCCGVLCECNRVRHRLVHEKIQDAHLEHCDDFDGPCPEADCRRPTHETVAVCKAGQCVAGRRRLSD